MPTVLITGLNGFVAVHAALEFLNQGWTVRGTVRSAATAEKCKSLTAYKDWVAGGKLEVVVVPDLAGGDLSEALAGVDAVAHVAAPFDFTLQTWELFRDGAVKGALNVLQQAKGVSSIKAVHVVSTFGAVGQLDLPYINFPDKVYTEENWYPTDEALCESLQATDPYAAAKWYLNSKTIEEEKTLEFYNKEKPSWALSTSCPTFIFGPPREIDTAEELKSAKGVVTQHLRDIFLANGGELPPSIYIAWVDVRDLSHLIYTAISKKASGRFLANNGYYDPQQFARLAPKLNPAFAKLVGDAGDEGVATPAERGGYFTIDTSKAERELGVSWRSAESMIKDVLDRYVEMGAA